MRWRSAYDCAESIGQRSTSSPRENSSNTPPATTESDSNRQSPALTWTAESVSGSAGTNRELCQTGEAGEAAHPGPPDLFALGLPATVTHQET